MAVSRGRWKRCDTSEFDWKAGLAAKPADGRISNSAPVAPKYFCVIPDDSFDVALCQLGLQFFADRPAALREMWRVLAPGGRVVVNMPLAAPEAFLWLYVHSTPLAAPVAQLDDESRGALARDIVAKWRPFTRDGGLVLEQGVAVATGRK